MEEDIKILKELRKELGLYVDGNKVKQSIAIENILVELEKKDKIIDYLIEFIRERSIYAVDNHKELKQYFEKKVEEENERNKV